MNKYCKLVLKFLNKHSSKNCPVPKEQLYKKIPFDKTTIDNSLKELESLKLINVKNYLTSSGQSLMLATYSSYWPTTIGKEYFTNKLKYNLIELLKIFLTSIFCPIVVSVITTLITIWLSGLFETK